MATMAILFSGSSNVDLMMMVIMMTIIMKAFNKSSNVDLKGGIFLFLQPQLQIEYSDSRVGCSIYIISRPQEEVFRQIKDMM